jgi:hypothetical protein
VEGRVHVLANELRGREITVNAVASGPVATELFLKGKTEAQIEQFRGLARGPPWRAANPDSLKGAAVDVVARRDVPARGRKPLSQTFTFLRKEVATQDPAGHILVPKLPKATRSVPIEKSVTGQTRSARLPRLSFSRCNDMSRDPLSSVTASPWRA